MDRESVTKTITASIAKMPSLPTTVAKILQVCSNPRALPADLNQVISLDPVLMGKVLRLINSAYYSLPNQVTSLVRAVIMLGINTVKNLALSTAVLGNLGKGPAGNVLNLEGFWRHSICATSTSPRATSICWRGITARPPRLPCSPGRRIARCASLSTRSAAASASGWDRRVPSACGTSGRSP